MKRVNLLKISYWIGAILDFIMAVVVLIPEKMGVANYVFPMGLISAIAISWGIMLILAGRKPEESRWILIPTIMIIVLSGFGVGSYALIMSIMTFDLIILEFILATVVSLICSLSYLLTRNLVKSTNRNFKLDIDLKKDSTKQNKIKWLRIGLWVPAIVDFIVAIVILFPEMACVESFVYPMGLVSTAGISWGTLLIMADRKPIERRWVLIPTIIVELLMSLALFLSRIIIDIPMLQRLLTLFFGLIAFSFTIIGYLKSRNLYEK